MKIEPLSSGCVRVWMDSDDMAGWGLSFETMSARDPATYHAVRRLVELLPQHTGAPPCGDLTLEAVPVHDGMVLLFSPRRWAVAAVPPVKVYAVQNTDALLQLFAVVKAANDMPQMAVYAWEGEYRLIVYPDGKLPPAFIEFAEPVGEGEACAAYVTEHGVRLGK